MKAEIEEPPPLKSTIPWAVIAVFLLGAVGAYISYRQFFRPKRVFLTRHQTFQIESGVKAKDDLEEDDSPDAEQRLSWMMKERPRCIVLTHNRQTADFVVNITVNRFPTDRSGNFGNADLSIVKRNGDVIWLDSFEQNLKSTEDIGQAPLNKAWEVLCGPHGI